MILIFQIDSHISSTSPLPQFVIFHAFFPFLYLIFYFPLIHFPHAVFSTLLLFTRCKLLFQFQCSSHVIIFWLNFEPPWKSSFWSTIGHDKWIYFDTWHNEPPIWNWITNHQHLVFELQYESNSARTKVYGLHQPTVFCLQYDPLPAIGRKADPT